MIKISEKLKIEILDDICYYEDIVSRAYYSNKKEKMEIALLTIVHGLCNTMKAHIDPENYKMPFHELFEMADKK